MKLSHYDKIVWRIVFIGGFILLGMWLINSLMPIPAVK